MKTVNVADLFCGAGGSSTGMVRAANSLGITIDLTAVNHWSVAVDTHTRNHPWARHHCADLASLDPNKAIGGDKLNILIASPECTHHSNARGGKPCSDQSRASAWHVMHWAERLNVDEILIENVKEFASWGPLNADGRPDKRNKGQTFEAFLNSLRSLGYKVEHAILNAADYGDATCRHRLFVRASRRGKIKWPLPTHRGNWRAARDVIDWSLKGKSIFNRERPLSPRTIKRIENGFKKFGGQPFIAVLRGDHPQNSSLDAPLSTISAGGTHIGLCEPFIIPMEHSGRQPLRTVKQLLPTITTAKGGSFGLCQPFLTKYYGSWESSKSVDSPIDTITAKDRFALCEPVRGDVLFRMLQPYELAAAMGFDGYEFAGTKKDQVRQIGNAVSVRTAQALCGEILKTYQKGAA